MGPYIDRCVPFQIMFYQLNLEEKQSRKLENKREPHTLGAQMQKCNFQRIDSQAVFIRVYIFASELLECAALFYNQVVETSQG